MKGAVAPSQFRTLLSLWIPLRCRTSAEHRYLSPLAKLQKTLEKVYTFLPKKPFSNRFITFFKYILSKMGHFGSQITPF